LNSELDWDHLCYLASTNGSDLNTFDGYCWSGSTSNAWVDGGLDLSAVPTHGNLIGQPNVWVAILFVADASINYPDGTHVDEVLLRKCTSGGCVLNLPTMPSSNLLHIQPFNFALDQR